MYLFFTLYLVVREEVDPAVLGGGRLDQVDPDVRLTQLVVRPAAVSEDLHAVQPHTNVRAENRAGWFEIIVIKGNQPAA